MKTRIFIAGHNGMVGSALVRKLSKNKDNILILASRDELDLCNLNLVKEFILENKLDQIYVAAAKVGGIYANNTYPAEFITDNIVIQSNIIQSAHESGIEKLLFLGSSCIYPQLTNQPMSENALLTGALEPTNEAYAVAKICGIKMCESYNRQYGVDYRSVMPTNLYGPNDNFHNKNSHVIPALMKRFHEAKIKNLPSVTVWGTGNPMREFLHVDDVASASIYIMNLPKNDLLKVIQNPMCSHINVGTGIDHTISDLAKMMADIVDYNGKILFDKSKPDGSPRKLLDVSRLTSLGWDYNIELRDGLKMTYKWFLDNINSYKT